MIIDGLKNKKWMKYVIGLLPLLIIGSLSIVIFYYYSPDYIVNLFGVENAYALIFITAIAGGFTTFNIIPYHILLITLAIGGLNPLLLGFLAAIGVSLGDSTSYFIGYQGRTILPEKMDKWFERVHRIGTERPKLFMLLCFLYSCFIPESNDFITIPAGLARLPFFNVMIPLVLGNIIFDISLAFLAPSVYDLLQGIFF
ncbi:MAG: hypothetical protein CEO12_581 [Parcubacteria group bacterium Gr01-1014_46]|nr:MAG: hypothetical protein CEO12_581 [Parcubacteria group bacterium Gr01-1014_46]